MTGKGDRWGRDRLGRSEPAFMAASTTALPHLPARREADFIIRQLLFLLRGRPTVGRSFVLRPEPDGESAGCVCLQCLVQQALFACLPFCLPYPLPISSFAPVQFALPPSSSCHVHSFHFASVCFPCSLPCAPGSVRASSLLLGPAVCQLRELSRWQLQHGPAVAARAPVHFVTIFFFLQSP